MTINQIYKELMSHMIKGMMVHQQMANYYHFLSLPGYSKCHEYHFIDETCNYRKLSRFFIDHYNMLIEEASFDNPNVIPKNWIPHTRQDVDINTKRQGVKDGIEKWLAWEKETKQLYERMYKQMMSIDEIGSALFLKEFINDVQDQLKEIYQYQLNLSGADYNMQFMLDRQDGLYDCFDCKLKKVFKRLRKESIYG